MAVSGQGFQTHGGIERADTQGNELLLQEEGRTGAGRSESTEAASSGMQ